MNSNIIEIGSLEVKWYSFLLLLAFSIGFIIVMKQRDKVNLTKTEMLDMLFYLIIVSIVGARVYYVIFNLDYYMSNPIDMIKIWEGGLAIHGGILFGIIYLFVYCRRKKIKLLNMTDIIVPSLVLGQAIGRWGNFFNQEAFGPITTYQQLKSLHIPNFVINGMYINHHYYHPTFFYESLFCLFIFIVLITLIKLKLNKRGICTSIYLILYGIERFFMEGLRQDSLMFFNFEVARIVSIIMIITGICILFFNKKKEYYDK